MHSSLRRRNLGPVTRVTHIRLLDRFLQRYVRCILGIHWSDFVTNNQVLEMAKAKSIEATGYVSRMTDTRLPKITLCGVLWGPGVSEH